MKYMLILLAFPLAVFALTISLDEYNIEFGLEASYYSCSSGTWDGWDPSVTSWDFSDYTSTETASVRIVNPSGQPGSGTFSSADYCEILEFPGYDTVYSYFSVTGSGVTGKVEQYGFFTTYEGMDVIAEFSSIRDVFMFPMDVGDTWTADYEWESGMWPLIYTFHETHELLLVGEGIVKVPASGDDWWECIVIQDHFTHVDDLGSDEDRWVYTWVVPNGFDGAGFPNTNGVFIITSNNYGTSGFTEYEMALAMNQTTANPDPWTGLEHSTWGSIKAHW